MGGLNWNRHRHSNSRGHGDSLYLGLILKITTDIGITMNQTIFCKWQDSHQGAAAADDLTLPPHPLEILHLPPRYLGSEIWWTHDWCHQIQYIITPRAWLVMYQMVIPNAPCFLQLHQLVLPIAPWHCASSSAALNYKSPHIYQLMHHFEHHPICPACPSGVFWTRSQPVKAGKGGTKDPQIFALRLHKCFAQRVNKMKEFAHFYLTWLISANGDDIDEKRAQLEESVLVYDGFCKLQGEMLSLMIFTKSRVA